MKEILRLYITLMPVILAGIFNMIFVKSRVLEKTYIPMDQNRTWRDGKPLFGPNKTWKGFFGMVVLTALSQVAWGALLAQLPAWQTLHLVYTYQPNTPLFNLLLGALLGLSYVLFELPNSFIKRRLDIPAGKPANNHWRTAFILIDQIDSLFGCALVLALFSPVSLSQFLLLLAIGTLTHLGVNRLLYLAKLRKNQM